MKGEDPKELKEWTFYEKIHNFIAASTRWTAVEGACTDEGILVSKSIEINFNEAAVQHMHIDPHLSYILLRGGTIITYLSDTDTLVIS